MLLNEEDKILMENNHQWHIEYILVMPLAVDKTFSLILIFNRIRMNRYNTKNQNIIYS